MWKRLTNLRIRTITYVLVAFMVVAGLIVATALTRTLQEVGNARTAWDTFSVVTLEKVNARGAIRDAIGLGGFASNYKDTLIKRSRVSLDAATKNAQQALDAVARYRALGTSPGEAKSLAAIESVLHQYTATIPTVAEWIDLGADVDDLIDGNPIDDKPLLSGLNGLDVELTKAKNVSEEAVHAAVTNAESNARVAALIVAFVLLWIIGSFLWVVRSRIIRPLDRLTVAAVRIGGGDLTAEISGFINDEVGALATEMNAMVKGLRAIAVQTRESAASLNSAATETLASTKQQAASVEQQFAAIQETTATLEEINQSGQQMTGRAREIASEAERAHERSKDGLKAMDDMTQVMDAIEEQTESVASHIVALSEKTQAIGDIISTVNDIAERSQLLALNAAIEAAAAGEGGRSFSVVADEIKTLADQAKEATSQVSSILGEIQKGINSSVMSTEESVKRVATGRGQAESTLKSITDLAETIEASVRAFDQIVASANQQRVGLEQVSEALQQIRSGSEQTAAGTRQIEVAVGNIGTLGARLDHAMERYAV